MTAVFDVDTRTANRLGAWYYAATVLVALVGATAAAAALFGVPWLVALPAVAVVELGGITLFAQADVRRRLGERALAFRTLSAAVAVFAVAFQWYGHADHRQGLFFAGVSSLAYATWLIHAGARRRDQLRGRPGAAALLPPPSPGYGWEWLRHPWRTRRARDLYRRDTTLGLYGSLDAAREQLRTHRRTTAIARVLRRKLTAAAGGRDAAAVAVTTYDLDRIAAGLAGAADYPGLIAVLAAELDPTRVATPAVPVDVETSGRQAFPVVTSGRHASFVLPPVLPDGIETSGRLDALTSGGRDVTTSWVGYGLSGSMSDPVPAEDVETSRRTDVTTPRRQTPAPSGRRTSSAGGRSASSRTAHRDRPQPDVSDLMEPGRAVRDRLAGEGRALTRDALLAGLREAGYAASSGRASALYAVLNREPHPAPALPPTGTES